MQNHEDLLDLRSLPDEIVATEMTMLAGDHDPPILVGEGRIMISDREEFQYEMRGVAPDIGHSLKWLNKIRANPYDGQLRCRLVFKTANGQRFNGGWTVPRAHPVKGGRVGEMVFCGVSDGLLLYELPSSASAPRVTIQTRIPEARQSYFCIRRFAHPSREIDVLGTKVLFEVDATARVLQVTAFTSEALQMPYVENWLIEPFRVMFGELLYPELILKEFGDGSATAALLAVGSGEHLPAWAGLWRGDSKLADVDGFWTMYVRLLVYIAKARQRDGNPYHEANPLTRHYEEIIQAATASRRVWALTLASTAEALVLELSPRGTVDHSADIDAIEKLVDHIGKWTGPNELKSAAAGAVRRKAEVTSGKSLRWLVAQGILSKDGVNAWEDLRHKVMHGGLVSIYSDKVEDDKILALIELVHELTDEIIRRVVNR